MAEAPPEVVDELYGAPLEEFIPLRDQRAKELRKADRESAGAIKKLRKPTVSAWAVNQLSRRSRDELDALLAAGEALREGKDIRAAAREEREAVERLVDLARPASDATLDDVRSTLHAVASDDEVRDLVSRGVLTEARAAVGLGGGFEAAFAAAAPAPSAPKKSSNKGKASGAAAKEKEKEKQEAAARKERQKAARAALKEAEKAAREADRAVAAAEKERDRAQRQLDEAEEALASAQSEAEAAHEAVERAREEAG